MTKINWNKLTWSEQCESIENGTFPDLVIDHEFCSILDGYHGSALSKILSDTLYPSQKVTIVGDSLSRIFNLLKMHVKSDPVAIGMLAFKLNRTLEDVFEGLTHYNNS